MHPDLKNIYEIASELTNLKGAENQARAIRALVERLQVVNEQVSSTLNVVHGALQHPRIMAYVPDSVLVSVEDCYKNLRGEP